MATSGRLHGGLDAGGQLGRDEKPHFDFSFASRPNRFHASSTPRNHPPRFFVDEAEVNTVMPPEATPEHLGSLRGVVGFPIDFQGFQQDS